MMKKQQKQRVAALKAWATIRRKRREEAAKGTRLLEDFMTPERIGSISHPEIATKFKKKKYGRGIICQFEKTPPNIVCGKFWELRWAFGCPLNCSYCYLRGTNRGNMRPRYIKVAQILSALDEIFNDPNFNDGKPAILNSGELCDSLMNPEIMSQICDKFEEQKKHKVLILTKFGLKNAQFLLTKRRNNVICAWSINAIPVAKMWESLAPSPEERIEAASTLSNCGYEVRVRIDPIFPIDNWKIYYEDLVYHIFFSFEPKRIILGTPRGLWKTLFYGRKAGVDMSWAKYFSKEETGWGKKLPLKLRAEIYKYMIDKLVGVGCNKRDISICKETRELLGIIGYKYKPFVCQCYSK